MEDIIDHTLVRFGCAMLEIVPGRVSTETDARFSFDVQGSIRKAQCLVKLYEEQGIGAVSASSSRSLPHGKG